MRRYTQKQKNPIDSLIFRLENSIDIGVMEVSAKSVKFRKNGFDVFFALHCGHSCSGTIMKDGHVVHSTKIGQISLAVSDVAHYIYQMENQS